MRGAVPLADFDELVELVAGLCGNPERLVAEHVPDASGHCRGCYSTAIGAPAWPCILTMIGRAITVKERSDLRRAAPPGQRLR